ncbi:hypothetical protein [Dyella sp. A6]|uniref:hypothetical protein n=1 Tax=Dyella aluminiiresistens TaxID=3069105 RepID=UPI002E75F0F2|nr:hypothetical protein [Dyella sp. A6]
MFGWLAAHPAAWGRPFHGGHAERRWLRMPGGMLAQHLMRLGHVLYLPGPAMDAALPACPTGWLAERRELAFLLRPHRLAVAGVVDTDGPREWLECVDHSGRVQARLYLLPDTDYLAWDALLAAGERVSAPQPGMPQDFRPRGACLARFHGYLLAGLTVFGLDRSVAVSRLGHEVAQRIARAEAVAMPRHVSG